MPRSGWSLPRPRPHPAGAPPILPTGGPGCRVSPAPPEWKWCFQASPNVQGQAGQGYWPLSLLGVLAQGLGESRAQRLSSWLLGFPWREGCPGSSCELPELLRGLGGEETPDWLSERSWLGRASLQ